MSNFRRRLMMSIETKTSAEKVYENPTEYYGKSITNYEANGVTDWKIFYSDGKNVYLIASDYVDVDKLPTTSAGNKPENKNSSYQKTATFSNVINDYDGSSNIIEEKIKALNSDYFNKGYTSINNNMKSVAYMLDTRIWSNFAGEKVEYAIGGPTVEMLMASYNQKYASNGIDYRAQATSEIGYQISKDGGVNWANYYGGILKTNDSLYVLSSSNDAYAMELASPSYGGVSNLMHVSLYGGISINTYNDTRFGFRPIVCLKSDIQLEEDEDGYKIN